MPRLARSGHLAVWGCYAKRMSLRRSTQSRIFLLFFISAALWLSSRQIVTTTSREQSGNLVINEFMAANQTGLTDQDGDYADWIELYNPGDYAVNLAGWALTDDPDQPQKWRLPDINLGDHEYLLIFASGKDRRPTQPNAELHTNFKLKRAGEFLGLYNTFDGRFVDTAGIFPGEMFPEQLTDIPFGRDSETSYGYLAKSTPGRPNDVAWLWRGLTAPVVFSQERGFYKAPLTLKLSTTNFDATIRYTTDGSRPTETHGTIYTAPLTIETTTLLRAIAFKPDFRPSSIETHSYIFLDDVLTQPPAPAGFPQTWGGDKGVPIQADYEIDPEIINHPGYSDHLEDAFQAIPSLSIVTDRQSFYDLYANPERRGRAWERPASVELIDPTDAQPGFHLDAGLRIQGGLGRSAFIPKHAFRLFFRDEYGAAKLKYPLFPDSPVDEFDTLTLRSGVNRSYAGFPDRENEVKLTTYTRDEWLRTSQIAMSGSGAHGMFVHLYLNGLYWGLYNLVERPDAAFMAAYFGGTEDDWQTITHAETLSNTSERFKALHKLAAAGQLADPENYEVIQAYLDVPHFIDYLILNWYSGNLDWGFNNWYASAPNSAGQIRYFVWDGERTWIEGAEIYMEFDEYENQPNLVKTLFLALLENPDFKMELADRMVKHLFNDGALTEAKAKARWLEINRAIELAIIGESARWGDTHFETPLTQADWITARDDVLRQMEGNPARLIDLTREAGYYPQIDPPQFNQLGDRVDPGFSLTMTTPSGEDSLIFYTTDGSDPRQPVTGAVAATATSYQTPIVLTTTTYLKARTFSGDAWSALNEAVFNLKTTPPAQVQITEIMYNPSGDDNYEFIELKNSSLTPLNLAGMSFEGIRWTFPGAGPQLLPGEFLVLVRNAPAFARRYPGVVIGGVYEGQLSNKGESIILKDAQGNIVVSVAYDDENGWPLSADGRGDSLTLINPQGDASRLDNWRASRFPNGSPGANESQ